MTPPFNSSRQYGKKKEGISSHPLFAGYKPDLFNKAVSPQGSQPQPLTKIKFGDSQNRKIQNKGSQFLGHHRVW